MLTAATHFLPLTQIRRERRLPQPGKVIVRQGQKVGASDILAETVLNPEFQILDIARLLGKPAANADKYLRFQPGDQLSKGDLIAGPVGITNRVVRAQHDAKVISAGDGQVLLELFSKPYQLKAGISGNVVELIPDRGAVIETTGALIQGVWGNGRLDCGVLAVIDPKPGFILTVGDMDVSLRGAVLLAGSCREVEVLRMAEELMLRGLILGSMSPELIVQAEKIRVPVIVIEGFGDFLMNPIAYKLLATNDRRETAVIAAVPKPEEGIRPEIIIPLPASENIHPPKDAGELVLDQRVRVVEYPHLGTIGTIQKVMRQVSFPGGLKAPAAEIRLLDGRSMVLPLVNLELIQ